MTVVNEIKFMDPEPTQGGRIDYEAIADVLKGKPKTWARVRIYRSTIGLASWRKGLGSQFQVISRAAPDGTEGTWVYARYLGDGEADAVVPDAAGVEF